MTFKERAKAWAIADHNEGKYQWAKTESYLKDFQKAFIAGAKSERELLLNEINERISNNVKFDMTKKPVWCDLLEVQAILDQLEKEDV